MGRFPQKREGAREKRVGKVWESEGRKRDGGVDDCASSGGNEKKKPHLLNGCRLPPQPRTSS